MSEVRLADSTLRQGEPVAWGSGQQELNLTKETWAPFKGRIRALIQSKDNPVMTTKLDGIAAVQTAMTVIAVRDSRALYTQSIIAVL